MRKFVWVVLTLLIVVALALSSCQAATVEEKGTTETVTGKVTEKETTKVETKEETTKEVVKQGPEMVKNIAGNLVEKPQYGGTIRYRVLPHQAEHYDPLWWDGNNAQAIINDSLTAAPWEKGPEGTGEYLLNYSSYDVTQYRGELLESFEQTDLFSCDYTLRQGVHFWNKPPVNGREVTADDMVWSWVRWGVNLQSASFWGPDDAYTFWNNYLGRVDRGDIPASRVTTWLSDLETYWLPLLEATGFDMSKEDVTKQFPAVIKLFEDRGYDVTGIPLYGSFPRKIDKYNIHFMKLEADIETWNDMASMWVLPHEVEEVYGTFDDWQTTVACGPWMPSDYVRDSSSTYDRNPNYWQHDPTLPDYQLPYADKLIVLVILDDSTYYAALRTAKIDIGTVVWHKVETFKETSPEMLFAETPPTTTHTVSVRTDIPPFNDVRVRRAAMLAIDHPAMANEFYEGNAYVYLWPIQPIFPTVFTQPEDLPEDVREL